MAKKRSVEIVLKAKDDTKAAFNSVDKNVNKVSVSSKQLTASMVTAGAQVAQLAMQAVRSFQQMARAAVQAVKDVAALGDQFHKMSLRVGLSVETLSDWSFILERAGTSVTSFELAFRAMVRQMDAAKKGSKTSIEAFEDLGISFKNADGSLRDANDVFTDTIDGLTELNSETEQMASALLLFGRAGTTMLPVLRQTKEELQDQRDLAREAGVAYSQDFANGAAALHDAFALLDRQADLFTRTMVEAFGEDAAVMIETFAIKVYDLAVPFAGLTDSVETVSLRVAVMFDNMFSTMDLLSARIKLITEGFYILSLAVDAKKWVLLDAAMDQFVKTSIEYGAVIGDITTREGSFELALRASWERRKKNEEAQRGLNSANEDGAAIVSDLVTETENYDDTLKQLESSLVGVGTSNTLKALEGDALRLTSVLKDVVRALAAVVVKLLFVKAIGFATGGIGSLFGGFEQGGQIPGMNKGGQIPAFAGGGTIPQAAFGYSVPDGPRGRDSRLIMAAPGEEVINRSMSRRLNRFLSAAESSAYVSPWDLQGGSQGGDTVVMNVGIPGTSAGIVEMQEGVAEMLSNRTKGLV